MATGSLLATPALQNMSFARSSCTATIVFFYLLVLVFKLIEFPACPGVWRSSFFGHQKRTSSRLREHYSTSFSYRRRRGTKRRTKTAKIFVRNGTLIRSNRTARSHRRGFCRAPSGEKETRAKSDNRRVHLLFGSVGLRTAGECTRSAGHSSERAVVCRFCRCCCILWCISVHHRCSYATVAAATARATVTVR